MTSGAASLVLLLLTEQQVPPSPTFKSGTVLVEVDVVVADKSGRPVRGLRKEDFEIAEDGIPVGIATFAAVDLPEPPSGVIPAPERVSGLLSPGGGDNPGPRSSQPRGRVPHRSGARLPAGLITPGIEVAGHHSVRSATRGSTSVARRAGR